MKEEKPPGKGASLLPNLCPFEALKEETELKRLLWCLDSFFPALETKKLFRCWTERYIEVKLRWLEKT